MNKDIELVCRSVCEAGLRLSAEGLVARTWGNISIRIDERRMAVTPSGIMYGDIRPEHIAIMDIFTGKWECRVKPSGERKLHAEIYKSRPDIGAVVHTHQLNASVCAAARTTVEVMSRKSAGILKTEQVLCGGYGLPGTGKLTRGTVSAIKDSMCALMANHGAVCLGRDIDEAFTVSRVLEKVCGEFIASKINSFEAYGKTGAEKVCDSYLRLHSHS